MIRPAPALTVTAVLTLAALPALAAPPAGTDPNSPMAAWYQSLARPDMPPGYSCCSAADCRVVKDRISTDGWQVWANGIWVDVPEEKVLRNHDNPTGRAVLCASPDLEEIFCFVPGYQV